MRKLLRILGYAAGFAATAAAIGVAYLYLRQPAMATAPGVDVPMTPERIARGKYIFTLAACDECHSERDFTRFAGPVVEGGRGKGFMFPRELGFPGLVVARNITPDPETGIGAWSDGEKIRAIREGVSRDGSALFPLMGYERFRHMSDDDVQALVAFLNTLTPISHPLPRTALDFPVNLMIKSAPKPAGSVPPPDRSNKLKYGEYLVTLAGCAGCHTAKGGSAFAGGEVFRFPGATVASANITPDPRTGIGLWSEEYFLERFYQYREYVERGSPKSSAESFTIMPWLNFAQLYPDDLKAIFAYLKSRPAVYNPVDTHPAELAANQGAR